MSGEPATQVIPVRSKLKIFFSIDIVGSTDFKGKIGGRKAAHSDPEHWTRPFLTFYETCRSSMGLHWHDVVTEISDAKEEDSGHFKFGDVPSFWKGAGDEVLFSKTVMSPLDALAAVHAVLRVMADQRTLFSSKPLTERLNVKGTAWLAGFPINNMEIILGKGDSDADGSPDAIVENFKRLADLDGKPDPDVLRDYIGPSVDLGFRLRAYSTSRKMVVSADLVWLLCHADKYPPKYAERCKPLRLPRIGYDKATSLKGIMDSDPYPMFWVESAEARELDKVEHQLLGHTEFAGGDDQKALLRRFCKEYLTGAHQLRMTPYIEDCFDKDVSVVPAEHQEGLRKLQDWVNGSTRQIQDIERPGDAAGPDVASEQKVFLDQVAPPVRGNGA